MLQRSQIDVRDQQFFTELACARKRVSIFTNARNRNVLPINIEPDNLLSRDEPLLNLHEPSANVLAHL
jgi:hypothetical protein